MLTLKKNARSSSWKVQSPIFVYDLYEVYSAIKFSIWLMGNYELPAKMSQNPGSNIWSSDWGRLLCENVVNARRLNCMLNDLLTVHRVITSDSIDLMGLQQFCGARVSAINLFNSRLPK